MALNRPYIRKDVRKEVERRAEKNEKGQFLDANTHKPIEGQYDLGHKAGHEYRREAKKAEEMGVTQKEFNDYMNNPDFYQIEDPHENRSHAYEMSDENYSDYENQVNDLTENINEKPYEENTDMEEQANDLTEGADKASAEDNTVHEEQASDLTEVMDESLAEDNAEQEAQASDLSGVESINDSESEGENSEEEQTYGY